MCELKDVWVIKAKSEKVSDSIQDYLDDKLRVYESDHDCCLALSETTDQFQNEHTSFRITPEMLQMYREE